MNNENPYASPIYTAPAGVGPDGKIYPTKAPADVLDLVIGIVRVLLRLSVVIVVPIAVSRLLSPRLTLIPLVPTLCWIGWASGRIVRSVSIDKDGLHFRRSSGATEDWLWHSILAIGPASRWEVAWWGWIRPLLNPRDRTNCRSTLGHYRIQGKADYCFFPPKNPEAFVEAIARYRPELFEQPNDK